VKGNTKRIFISVLTAVFLTGLAGCGDKEAAVTTRSTVTETEAAVEQAATEAVPDSSQAFELTVTGTNSWESGGMVCAQFDGVIKNKSGGSAANWKVSIPVPEGSKLENGWNGTYTLEETTLEITPAEYNTEITADGEVTFGFILDTKEAFTPSEGTLSIDGVDYAMGASETSPSGSTEASEEQTEAAAESKEVAKKDISGTPVENHGALSVEGTDIVDKDGNIFQLKGVSTHGINWFPEYVNKEAFSSLAGYGVNAIRLAMYTADYNGYCSGGSQKELEDLVDKGVEACNALGLYVIIDWHILNDNNPNQNKDSAKSFFETMSKKYAGYDNVIYEICNEPNGGTTWDDIKSYAEEIIPVIRKNDKNALIIVGTPNWSQDVDTASQNKIEGQQNLVYAVHFYASTHKEEIRSKVETARQNGLPVIVSECSICEASGNGSINYDEAEKWMEMINEYHLSYFAWNLSNKEEQSSLLKSSVTKTGNFETSDFSETGSWFIEKFCK
jgi:endoglucanase